MYLKILSWYSERNSVRRDSALFILITVNVCSRYPCSNDSCSHAHGDSRPHHFHLYYQVYEGWAHIFITTLCHSIPYCCFSAGILCSVYILRVFWPKGEKVGGWNSLFNEGFHTLYSLNIDSMINQRVKVIRTCTMKYLKYIHSFGYWNVWWTDSWKTGGVLWR